MTAEASALDLDQRVEAAFQRHRRGDLGFAQGVYRAALRERPDHPAALHYLGLLAQQTGRSKEGADLLERALKAGGPDKRIYNHLGQIYFALSDTRRATESFEAAIALDPDHVEALNNLANVLRVRDLDRAIALYRRALALAPRAAFAVYNLAEALNEDGAFDEALQLYRRTLELDPRHLHARHSLGVLLEQKGAFEEATQQYQAVLRIDPRHTPSLANLIAIREHQPSPDLVRAAEQRLAGEGILEEERIKLHQGLGKHYDRSADYERAFAHFERSKTLLRRQAPAFDLAAAAKSMARTAAAFPRSVFAAESGRLSERPVFIVGLPRSGTTLTEQILASHPQVFGAGELGDMPRIVKSLRPDYPESVAAMPAAELAALADEYLEALDAVAPGTALRVTDKMPVNSLNLGMIAALLPQARIVYCRRDPLDVAISCYIELFELEHDYTSDFSDFGRYFLEHERLMAHWRAVLPTPIHEVRYEDLVSDLEGEARKLIAYLGLDWAPECLEFQKTERTVQTPSRWQVRQPIYSSSLGRWRNYETRLEPLKRILAEAGFHYAKTSEVLSAPARPAPSPDLALPKALQRPLFIVAAPRSGSTLLFETLAASAALSSVGGEAHWLVESIRDLQPGPGGVDSNRLLAAHATPANRRYVVERILETLVDAAGRALPAHTDRIFLEKTPKNALRIPFFDAIFPDARFVFLWRDPRENISSIMEAWRSGKFRTYKSLQGFAAPWSLLLPPGYAELSGRPLEEIAAFQWAATNRIILDDLEALAPERSIVLEYGAFLKDPRAAVERIFAFAGLAVDEALARRVSGALPHSRYTESAPAAEKWRRHEEEISRVLPSLEAVWSRLQKTPSALD